MFCKYKIFQLFFTENRKKKVGKGILFRLERGGAPQKGGTGGYSTAVMV